MSNYNEVSMLCLTLGKKWLPEKQRYTTTENNKQYQEIKTEEEISPSISLFGYYDSLKIEEVKSWHKFRPRMRKNSGGEIKDEYTIRAVSLCEKRASVIETIEKHPIVACTLVHFTDEFLSKQKEWKSCYKNFKDLILDGGECFKKDNLNYGLYFGLGYPDAVVIFFANGIDDISECIDQLRKIKCEDKTVVSSAYTLIGYYNCSDNSLYNALSNETISAVMNFAFNKNCCYDNQKKSLQELFNKYRNESEKDKPVGHMMFGSFDWQYSIKETSLKDFILFHKNHLAFINDNKDDKDSESFFAKLSSMETRLLLNDGTCSGLGGDGLIEAMEQLDPSVYGAFEQYRNYYIKLKSEFHAHNRVLGSISNIILQYFKIVSTGHCHDVKRNLGKFITSFLTTSTALMMHMESGKDSAKIFNCEGHEYNSDTYYRLIEETSEQFRDAVDPLLFDLWRSDSPYFEGQTSAHPTVGSVAKVLFAYNETLSQWDHIVEEENSVVEENEPETGFCYLVTSGGRDITINIDLFDYNHDILTQYRIIENKVVKSENEGVRISRPIIVAIPEASLYDVNGTIYRLAHEFFHKRSNRLRDFRAVCYFNTLCDMFTSNCKYYLLGYLLRKKAQNIFNNRIYMGELREAYNGYPNGIDKEKKNNEIFGEWLQDLDLYFSKFKKFEKFYNPNNHEEYYDPDNTEDENSTDNCSKYWEEWGKVFKDKSFHCREYLEKAKTYSDFKVRVIELNTAFYNVATELSALYKKIKESDLTESCCEDLRLKLNELLFTDISKFKITKNENHINTHGAEIYNICYFAFQDSLQQECVVKEAGKILTKFVLKISKFIYDNNGPFGDIAIKARGHDNLIGLKLWKEIVERYVNFSVAPPLLNITNITEWMKDIKPVYEHVDEWFKETYADCMSLFCFGVQNQPITNFLQYIFVYLFETRNHNMLFYDTSYVIDGNKPPIGFFGHFMRVGLVAEIVCEDVIDNFRDKKSTVVEIIKNYYQEIMYPADSHIKNNAEEYAENLYEILARFIKYYKECSKQNCSGYTKNITDYLKECRDCSLTLCKRIKDSVEINSDDDNADSYISFIMNKWLDIYSE